MDVRSAIIGLVLAAGSGLVDAQYCEMAKEPAQKARVDSVLAGYVESFCCHTTLAKCVKAKPQCTIARRFTNFACYLTLLDRDYAKIREELGKRDSCFHASPTTGIDTSMLPLAGDPHAPVLIVAYINSSCPKCKKVIVPIYAAVTDGPLRGRAALALVPLSAQVGNVAYLAARGFGRFWEYFLSLAQTEQRIDEGMLIEKAEWLGIPRGRFEPLLYDKSLDAALTRNYNKAKAMGISSTPTVFINGKRYRSILEPEWIVDGAEYEYERLKAAQAKKARQGK